MGLIDSPKASRGKYERLTDGIDGFQALANAIVEQAVVDYRDALGAVKRNPSNRTAAGIAAEMERFFRSPWYALLTDVDPDCLIQRMRKE